LRRRTIVFWGFSTFLAFFHKLNPKLRRSRMFPPKSFVMPRTFQHFHIVRLTTLAAIDSGFVFAVTRMA
jgi:hypothetical protein